MTGAALARPDERAPARLRFTEHPLEVTLRLFGDVRPGETLTVFLMTANIFMLLTAYYLLKVAREPLILLGGGAEVKSYAAVGQAILLIFVTNLYSWVAARVRRFTLIAGVTLFFAANLVVFWVLGSRGLRLGVPFFLWVGIFNLVTVAQFWSLAADMYTEEQGKRLFPVIGIGSSVGAISGAAIAGGLIRHGSPFILMLSAAGLLVATHGVTNLIHRREAALLRAGKPHHDEPLGHGNAFALVAKDNYLLLLAALILVLNISTKTGDYVLDRMLISHAAVRAASDGLSQAGYIGEFKARYFEWINVLEVLVQSLAVSRIIKYAGVRAALTLVPMVSLLGYASTLVAPLIGVLFATRIAENTLDYSLSNTVRQALWLVTSRDAKYKAKQVVDSFVWRAGDSMSALIVFLGSRHAMGLRWFIAINVVVAVIWVGVAATTGMYYVRRRPVGEAAPP